MSRVTLAQWQMLAAVVDYGGFARAAEAIRKSPSTLNHAVHKLEEQFGVQVLEPAGRQVRLTAAGELLLRRSRQLIEGATTLEDVASRLASGLEAQGFLGEPLGSVRFMAVAHPGHALYQLGQRWTVGHLSTSVEMVKSGLGFAWLPETHIAGALESGALKALPLTAGGVRHVPIQLFYSDRDRAGPATHAMAKALYQAVGKPVSTRSTLYHASS